MKKLALMPLALVCVFLFSASLSHASPASPAMMDGNGCHTCKDVCKKFGVANNEYHCHIFSPEAFQTYKRAASGSASNPETMFSENILVSMDYVSLKADKSGLMIAPSTKKFTGSYKVVSQSCGFGSQPIPIRDGAPSQNKKLFNVNLNPTLPGLYTITLQGQDYPAIATANNRFIVVNAEDDIVCGGQSVKENLYLYCKSTLNAERRAGVGGICRTSLLKGD